MSKLKAPLLSLGASGALGKALVFFPWKGLDCVREYVIPANPQTDAQTEQRDYLKDAVAKIHVAQAHPTVPFINDDAISYSLLGSLKATPRTWFNTICKQWIDQKILGKIPAVYHNGSCSPGTKKLTLKGNVSTESGTITNGKIYYGTSKSALVSSISCTLSELEGGKEIPNLSAGVKYFCQFRATTPTTFDGTNSGIWHGTPT